MAEEQKRTTHLTRDEAWVLLTRYNKDAFHLHHAETVEKTMRWFARELGYAEEEGIATRRRAEAFIVNGEVTVTGQIGAALGVHTGPGLIGIGVLQR